MLNFKCLNADDNHFENLCALRGSCNDFESSQWLSVFPVVRRILAGKF
jgi:hypothetical protein